MKDNYVGLDEHSKQYLQLFDEALAKGEDLPMDMLNMPQKMREEIREEIILRNADMMSRGYKSGLNVEALNSEEIFEHADEFNEFIQNYFKSVRERKRKRKEKKVLKSFKDLEILKGE